jgi:hypothetical protein
MMSSHPSSHRNATRNMVGPQRKNNPRHKPRWSTGSPPDFWFPTNNLYPSLSHTLQTRRRRYFVCSNYWRHLYVLQRSNNKAERYLTRLRLFIQTKLDKIAVACDCTAFFFCVNIYIVKTSSLRSHTEIHKNGTKPVKEWCSQSTSPRKQIM